MVHRSFNRTRGGIAFIPQSIANAAAVAYGPTISKPAQAGRTMLLRIIAGTIAGNVAGSLVIGVQGQLVTGGAWENILSTKDGNPVKFDVAAASATVDLQNNSKKGTLFIDRLPYENYRLYVDNDVGGAAIIGATYEIGDIFDSDSPAEQKDHLLWDTTPYEEFIPLATAD